MTTSTSTAYSSFLWKFTIDELADAFADVVRVDVTDPDTANVAAIDYTEAFHIAYGYFRAVQLSREVSWRTLRLSATCLQLNPANYTVWHYRRHCIDTLYHTDRNALYRTATADKNRSNSSRQTNIDDWSFIDTDLDIAASLGGDNPKNYQIWYHRRALLERLPPHIFLGLAMVVDGDDDSVPHEINECAKATTTGITYDGYGASEFEYIQSVINIDSKNYHAWSHRQWVLSNMVSAVVSANADVCSDGNDNNSAPDVLDQSLSRLWKSELKWTEALLQDDVWNNSAWNHRWFIVHFQNQSAAAADVNVSLSSPLSLTLAQREMTFALHAAATQPHNESSWRYFLAILKEQVYSLEDAASVMSLLTDAEHQILVLVPSPLAAASENANERNGDVPDEKAVFTDSVLLLAAMVDILEWKGDDASLQEAIRLMKRAEAEQDVIRRSYWQYRMRQIEQRTRPTTATSIDPPH